jgi:hypothetical protein
MESTGADSTFPDTATPPIIDAQRPEMMPSTSIVEILRHIRWTSWPPPCLKGTLQEPMAPAESFAVLGRSEGHELAWEIDGEWHDCVTLWSGVGLKDR